MYLKLILFGLVTTCGVTLSAQCFKEVDCGYSTVDIPGDWLSHWDSADIQPEQGFSVQCHCYGNRSAEVLKIYNISFLNSMIDVNDVPLWLKKSGIINDVTAATYSSETNEWIIDRPDCQHDSSNVKIFARSNGVSIKAISLTYMPFNDSIVEPIHSSWVDKDTGRRHWPDIDELPGALCF